MQIAEAEVCELRAEGARPYFRDLFNFLDLLLLLLLLLVQTTHLLALHQDMPELRGDVAVPLQSLATLGAWLRLLQCIYIWPNSGPKLLMTMHMLSDLGHFILMISFFLLAFSCSFVVLLYHSDGVARGGSYLHLFIGEEGGHSAWKVIMHAW